MRTIPKWYDEQTNSIKLLDLKVSLPVRTDLDRLYPLMEQRIIDNTGLPDTVVRSFIHYSCLCQVVDWGDTRSIRDTTDADVFCRWAHTGNNKYWCSLGTNDEVFDEDPDF